jgi:hypothetical protein
MPREKTSVESSPDAAARCALQEEAYHQKAHGDKVQWLRETDDFGNLRKHLIGRVKSLGPVGVFISLTGRIVVTNLYAGATGGAPPGAVNN